MQASVDTATTEGLAQQKSDYVTLADEFYEYFNQETDAEMYGPGVLSSVLVTIAKRFLGWCVHESPQTLRQVPHGVKDMGANLRQSRPGRKVGRKSRGVRKDRESQWARVSTWAATWDVATESGDLGDLLHPDVTGTLSEPAWRMHALLDDCMSSADMSAIH